MATLNRMRLWWCMRRHTGQRGHTYGGWCMADPKRSVEF